MRTHINQIWRSALILLMLLAASSFEAWSQAETMSAKQISKWYKKGEWKNGCQLKPHSSTNQKAFAKEYFGNKALWDKTFTWLKTTDLNNLAPGRYVIEEGNSTATVSEAPAPELDKVRWEFHKNFNDIQYIVKGKTLMGSVPMSEAKVTDPLDPKRDLGFGTAEGELYSAGPGIFFIFTPDDLHRPGIKAEGYDEPVKKIVIKVRAASSE
jgi:YhcH/YjgK/YiaL family protein